MSLERTGDPERSGKACESCKAWEPVTPLSLLRKRDVSIQTGLCRRLPPVIGSWPRTLANDWCWDYIASPQGPAERT